MQITFTTPLAQKPGSIADLLKSSYAEIVSSAPEEWEQEISHWEEFDADVFQFPDTVGACAFLTWYDERLAGMGSYDNQQRPRFGIVGHNCILPEFRGKGFGKLQMNEILRRFTAMRILLAKVSTVDHRFFIPAQRMYLSCGFREVRRAPWDRNPELNIIEYEKKL